MRERVNYFILNNGALFSTDNCGIENNLEDCIYIEKTGTSNSPEIYILVKKRIIN